MTEPTAAHSAQAHDGCGCGAAAKPPANPQAHRGHDHHAHAAPAGGTAKDPVCGMTVEIAAARHKTEHQGQT
jgi:Cu+-exporting ATPase